MTEARDREEFADPLQESQHERLKEGHGPAFARRCLTACRLPCDELHAKRGISGDWFAIVQRRAVPSVTRHRDRDEVERRVAGALCDARAAHGSLCIERNRNECHAAGVLGTDRHRNIGRGRGGDDRRGGVWLRAPGAGRRRNDRWGRRRRGRRATGAPAFGARDGSAAGARPRRCEISR